MSPDGTVTMREIMAASAEGGNGTLIFQGRSYPFKLVGGVSGGGGAANYTQSSGGPGLAMSGASDLWLGNTAGVMLHLRGTQEGMS